MADKGGVKKINKSINTGLSLSMSLILSVSSDGKHASRILACPKELFVLSCNQFLFGISSLFVIIPYSDTVVLFVPHHATESLY